MDTTQQQYYSKEELLAKKYNDLFKISKTIGIRTAKKLKTDKLIEAILKQQQQQQEGEATTEHEVSTMTTASEVSMSHVEEVEGESEEGRRRQQKKEGKGGNAQEEEEKEKESIKQQKEEKNPNVKQQKEGKRSSIWQKKEEKGGIIQQKEEGKGSSSQEKEEKGPNVKQQKKGRRSSIQQQKKGRRSSIRQQKEEEGGIKQQKEGKGGSSQKKEELKGSRTQGKGEEEEEQEEMLLDIQFPDSGSQDSLIFSSDDINTTSEASEIEPPRTGGRRPKASVPARTHKRRRTYDKEEEEEEREEKNKDKEEKQTVDSQQLSDMLESQVTVRGSRQPSSNTAAAAARVRGQGPRRSSVRLSITPAAKRRRESVAITPASPAPPLRPTRKSLGITKASPALPKSSTTTTTSITTTSKPVFTIGHGNTNKTTDGTTKEAKKGAKEGSSGIPRFLSYARRLKVPNFARIHEQAFQRMEGLDDYVDKRKARIDSVGSTTKKQQPPANVFQPSVTSVKNLNLDFGSESTSDDGGGNDIGKCDDTAVPIEPSPPKNPHGATYKPSPKSAKGARLSQRAIRHSTRPSNPQEFAKKPSTSMTRKSVRVTSPKIVSPKFTKRPSPKTMSVQKVSVAPKASQKATPPTARRSHVNQGSRASLNPVSGKKTSTMKVPVFGSGSHVKENQKPGKMSVSSPMPRSHTASNKLVSPASVGKRMQDNNSKKLAARGTGYVPYKGALKPLKERTDLKQVAQRKHNAKSSKQIREDQRNLLKGVRLNRRFELQMANRGIKFE